MRCPFCGHAESQVKDSRPSEDGAAIRRRRLCPECGGRFTTFERVQLRELTIVKRSGRRTPFERDKLARSIYVALRKRPVEPERVERMINSLVRQLESSGETEIRSEQIGEEVMEALSERDSGLGTDEGWLYSLQSQFEHDGVLYVHGSPLSDVESFAPEPGHSRDGRP